MKSPVFLASLRSEESEVRARERDYASFDHTSMGFDR